MMEDFFTALAEFSVQVGAGMIQEALDPAPTVELDKTAMADGVLESCIEQAARIVHEFGLIGQLDDRRGDFGKIVGIIANEQLGIVKVLTGVDVALLEHCSKSPGEMCVRAVRALRAGDKP